MKASAFLLTAVIVVGMVMSPGHLWAKEKRVSYTAKWTCPGKKLITKTVKCIPGKVYTVTGICGKFGPKVTSTFTCGSGGSEFDLGRIFRVGFRAHGGGLHVPRTDTYKQGVAVFGLASLAVRFPELFTPWWGVELSGGVGPGKFPSKKGSTYRFGTAELASVWRMNNQHELSLGYRFLVINDKDEDLGQTHSVRLGWDYYVHPSVSIGLSGLLSSSSWAQKISTTVEGDGVDLFGTKTLHKSARTWAGELRLTWWFWN